jgi:hypothetical protein
MTVVTAAIGSPEVITSVQSWSASALCGAGHGRREAALSQPPPSA